MYHISRCEIVEIDWKLECESELSGDRGHTERHLPDQRSAVEASLILNCADMYICDYVKRI